MRSKHRERVRSRSWIEEVREPEHVAQTCRAILAGALFVAKNVNEDGRDPSRPCTLDVCVVIIPNVERGFRRHLQPVEDMEKERRCRFDLAEHG